MDQQLEFEDAVRVDRGEAEPAMMVDVDGFAGPLDLLLELARRQKVDLQKISVLALAEQYLVFVEQARTFRLELAADYLVMAAWLAYLKSRLLLPAPPKPDEPTAEELAEDLAKRLVRLEAIRAAAQKLVERNRLGRDVFARGMPEPVVVTTTPEWEASLFDLLSAYARERQKHALSHHTVVRRQVWSLAEARETLQRLVGVALDWTVLDEYLSAYMVEPSMRATVRASTFVAALEMVREGLLDLQQDRAFAPIWLKARSAAAEAVGA
ncbi:segregation/condensation protein A [Alsobacter soli]|uniref:Segregation and condensation protein A n=1 Tax=Alsobacter soli TaxID=2109933 RepID=A0A2T1HMB6_9HYPH|nr:ScpA family protein [Alsobacter soli]PSC02794.1 segregation/condensation protein A [Alsobacter soli]